MKLFNLKTLAIAVITAVCVNANAQEKQNYVLNNFWDNWYISAGAGAQIYWGDKPAASNLTLSERPTITYGVALGKWITPSFGVRLAGNYTPASMWYNEGIRLEMLNVHFDAMLNLSSAIGGYKPTRFYELVLFGGAGLNSTTVKTPTQNARPDNAITLDAGLINKFRISKSFDINIELGGILLPRHNDGYTRTTGVSEGSNRFADASVYALGSITYRFGHKEFERAAAPAAKIDLTPYTNRIKELESSLSAANAKAAELNKRINDLLNAKKPVETVKETMAISSLSTFFNIGSYNLGAKEQVNLGEIAEFIKQNKDVKYKLSGLIDYSVGSKKRNDFLCNSRVDAVYNQLVKLGVSESQLVKSTDAPTSPSKNPILNRGVAISTIK